MRKHVNGPCLVVVLEDDSHASHPQPAAGSPRQRVDVDLASLGVLRQLVQFMADTLAIPAWNLAQSLVDDMPPAEYEATCDQPSPAEA